MSTTRIFVTKDAALAATTGGFWKNKPGYKVFAVGPTDKIEVAEADGTTKHWQSGAGPWFAVVATQDAAT